MFFTPKTYKDDDIDKDLRTEIAALNKKLFKAIMTKNIKTVKSLMTKQLVDSSGKRIDTVINTIASVYKAKNYRVVGEYYSVHSSFIHPTSFVVNDNLTSYTISFKPIAMETYTSVIVSKDLPINCCILAIYAKNNDTWGLTILEMGSYDVLGKTAPDYYSEAIDKFHKGDTIDAAEMIIIASEIGSPRPGKYIQYSNLDDMKDFYTSTLADANAPVSFPYNFNRNKNRSANSQHQSAVDRRQAAERNLSFGRVHDKDKAYRHRGPKSREWSYAKNNRALV